MGGAVASWVLVSDDVNVRTGRSLTVAADWYRNHLNWAETMRPHAADAARHDAQIAHIEKRAEQVRALRLTRQPTGRLRTTDLIEEVNGEIWIGDTGRAIETMGLWRSGSGDAHALGWPILTRDHELTSVDGGVGNFVTDPSIRNVADAYFCAYDFVAFGFYRLTELGLVPDHTQ